MDSGRLALFEKAREFGATAQNEGWNHFLKRSVTYRTLAQLLGIHEEWWDEFWRSFFSTRKCAKSQKAKRLVFCGKAKDTSFLTMFFSSWFGGSTRRSEVSEEDFSFVYHLVMRKESK